jgi:hypothetical protein
VPRKDPVQRERQDTAANESNAKHKVQNSRGYLLHFGRCWYQAWCLRKADAGQHAVGDGKQKLHHQREHIAVNGHRRVDIGIDSHIGIHIIVDTDDSQQAAVTIVPPKGRGR